jgi:hypothetical protein
MCHVIYTTIVNSYIMHKVHKTYLNKSMETMSRLKFNVALARVFIKNEVFYSKGDNNDKGFCTQSQRVA